MNKHDISIFMNCRQTRIFIFAVVRPAPNWLDLRRLLINSDGNVVGTLCRDFRDGWKKYFKSGQVDGYKYGWSACDA